MTKDVEIQLLDNTKKLGLKGNVPNGSITITTDGKILLMLKNDRYCVTKGLDDKDITLTEDIENCKLPGEDGGNSGGNEGTGGNTDNTEKTIGEIGTTTATCVTRGTCTAAEIKEGIKVNVEVNEEKSYDFYVIADDGEKVTLIMDRNLGDNVAWYADDDDNGHGPTTAVAALKERTSGWANIPKKEYTYSDEGGQSMYPTFTETMRARLITYTEATSEEIGCTGIDGSCPSWMYANLYDTGSDKDSTGVYKQGYWTSAAYSPDSYSAWHVDYNSTTYFSSVYASGYGLRPVIELTK